MNISNSTNAITFISNVYKQFCNKLKSEHYTIERMSLLYPEHAQALKKYQSDTRLINRIHEQMQIAKTYRTTYNVKKFESIMRACEKWLPVELQLKNDDTGIEKQYTTLLILLCCRAQESLYFEPGRKCYLTNSGL